MWRYGLIWESVPAAELFRNQRARAMRRKVAPSPNAATLASWCSLFVCSTGTLHFTFSVAHAQDRKKSMQVIDKRSMPSGTFPEMDSRQQWLHVDIPIITEVEISSAQAAGVCTKTKLSVREPHSQFKVLRDGILCGRISPRGDKKKTW
jgi:hypothetical protein